MAIEIGDIIEIPKELRNICGYFDSHKNAKYIKITEFLYQDKNLLKYEIIDKNHDKISWCSRCFKPEHLKNLPIINKINKPTLMTSLTQKVKDLFTSEPEKSFRKVGIMDEKGDITIEGSTIFRDWLFKKHAEEFKKDIVDPIIQEMKKEKNG